MAKKWYAVQVGKDDNDWGTGSHNLKEARKMANAYKRNERRDGEMIRIAVIEMGEDPTCIDEIIIREGE